MQSVIAEAASGACWEQIVRAAPLSCPGHTALLTTQVG